MVRGGRGVVSGAVAMVAVEELVFLELSQHHCLWQAHGLQGLYLAA